MSTLGEMRYESDTRQFGGLLMALAALVTMNSLTDIVATVAGPSTPNSGQALFGLIAALALCVVGITGTLQGYYALVQGAGNKMFSGATVVITQLAWLPFIGGMVGVGRGSQADPLENAFVPVIYNPTSRDVKFVAAMGIMSILAYASSFVGSMAFGQFALFNFQSGKAETYNAMYYKKRLVYYSFLLFLAGVAQFLLGCYTVSRFGKGPLLAPIGAGPLITVYPSISIVVGLVQLFTGCVGMARGMGFFRSMMPTCGFQWSCQFVWVLMLSMQIMVQLGYPAGPDLVASAPTLGCLYFAIAFMPAYLDQRAEVVPETVEAGYYASSSAAAGEAEEMENEKEHEEEPVGEEQAMAEKV